MDSLVVSSVLSSKANTWLRLFSRNCWGIMNKIILNLGLTYCPAISWIMGMDFLEAVLTRFLTWSNQRRLMIRRRNERSLCAHGPSSSHVSLPPKMLWIGQGWGGDCCTRSSSCVLKAVLYNVAWRYGMWDKSYFNAQDDISESVMEEISSSTSHCSSSSSSSRFLSRRFACRRKDLAKNLDLAKTHTDTQWKGFKIPSHEEDEKRIDSPPRRDGMALSLTNWISSLISSQIRNK